MFPALFLLAGPAIAASAQPTDPRQLFARSYAASGGSAWDAVAEIVEIAHIRALGTSATFLKSIDMRTGSFKMADGSGVAYVALGADAQGAWKDLNGSVQASTSVESLRDAATSAFIARDGWWHPTTDPATLTYLGRMTDAGRFCDVVGVLPRGGYPIAVWIDATSHLIHKYAIRSDAGQTRSVVFADYRRIHGIAYPFQQVTNVGASTGTTVVSDVDILGRVREADLARPVNRLAGRLVGGSTAVVPFVLSEGDTGHIFVSVMIDGKGPFNLLFDSGGQNTLTPDAAKRIGLQSGGSIPVAGLGARSVASRISEAKSVSIGNATLANQPFLVLPLPPLMMLERHDLPLDGIVGYEFLKNFVVSIDYAQKLLTFSDPGTFHYTGAGTAVPFTTDGEVPLIRASVNGAPGVFQIDTGSSESLMLFSAFLQSNDLAATIGPGTPFGVTDGIGGSSTRSIARVRSLAIGPYEVKAPLAVLSDRSASAGASDEVAGNIGGEILSRFAVTFDYTHDVVYFEPNANIASPFPDPRTCGFTYYPVDTGMMVTTVTPGGPAALAGMNEGDVVQSVNGVSSQQLGIADMDMMLQGSTTFTIVFLRDGQQHTVTMPLTDLLTGKP